MVRAGKIEQAFIKGSPNTVAKCRSKSLEEFVVIYLLEKKFNATYIDHGSLRTLRSKNAKISQIFYKCFSHGGASLNKHRRIANWSLYPGFRTLFFK